MSEGVDLSQFYDMFFDEADELLADMEQTLLQLDVDSPDMDQLNAIFRAAHSIKGGAGTFGCFGQLADTTHLLENLLDGLRQGEMTLRKDMVDLFLETKDVLSEQVSAYRNGEQPNSEAYERICAQLKQLALEEKGEAPASAAVMPVSEPVPVAPVVEPPAQQPMQHGMAVRQLGIVGKAFDTPDVRRAYTYSDQPDNVVAMRLGKIASISPVSGGDFIDYGLQLLQRLQDAGFGVFELDGIGKGESNEG